MRRYQELAQWVAFLVTGSAADAEDAAQEAFVKAWYALDRFRAGSPFRPWLLRIVANEASNGRRTAGRQYVLAKRQAVTPATTSPEEAVVEDDRRRVLLSALATLKEDDRLVVAYRYFLDFSQEETAMALGWRIGTVKSRLSRALRRLRHHLEEEGVAL